MTSALFYLQFQSFKNRMVFRVRRLRKPKYLVGAVVGGLYFYFYFFRYFAGGARSTQMFKAAMTPESRAIFETLGALALLVIVLLAWLIPHSRAALAFTEAEIAFLFPAPISRSGLIHFKLIKSQTAILFTTFFLTIVTGRFGRGSSAWIHAAGWWIILSTLNLHFLGCSFARTLLLERGVANWKRRLGVLLVFAIAVCTVIFWSRQTMRPPEERDFENIRTLGGYFQGIFSSGPAPYLLYPFRMLARPYLAADAFGFLRAVWPALLLMGLHYVWVVRSNVAFEENSLALSQRLAERVAAIRRGDYQPTKKKASRAPFELKPIGPPFIALMWKNLISAGKMFNIRFLILLCVMFLPVALALVHGRGNPGITGLIGMVLGMVIVWSVLIGPQMLRQDLRQDLQMADILKLYPIRGWQLVLGELLAPAVLLTIVQWIMIFTAAILVNEIPPNIPITWSERLPVALGAALLAPFLNVISLIIPNAAVLWFPGWFQSGREGPQGIEATGQRLIFVLGQMLVFVLVLIPAGIGFGVGMLLFNLLTNNPFAGVPFGALLAAAALAGEAILALKALGRAFEKFDLSAEGQS
jgi:hypothetical protein